MKEGLVVREYEANLIRLIVEIAPEETAHPGVVTFNPFVHFLVKIDDLPHPRLFGKNELAFVFERIELFICVCVGGTHSATISGGNVISKLVEPKSLPNVNTMLLSVVKEKPHEEDP